MALSRFRQAKIAEEARRKINGVMKYSKSGKGSEMKSGQVSDTLAPKCSSTRNVSTSREVLETTVEVGSSANT